MTCFHESWYIQYSISDDILMTQNIAILLFQLDCHFYVINMAVLFNVFNWNSF